MCEIKAGKKYKSKMSNPVKFAIVKRISKRLGETTIHYSKERTNGHILHNYMLTINDFKKYYIVFDLSSQIKNNYHV